MCVMVMNVCGVSWSHNCILITLHTTPWNNEGMYYLLQSSRTFENTEDVSSMVCSYKFNINWEALHVGTVPTFKMHKVGSV